MSPDSLKVVSQPIGDISSGSRYCLMDLKKVFKEANPLFELRREIWVRPAEWPGGGPDRGHWDSIHMHGEGAQRRSSVFRVHHDACLARRKLFQAVLNGRGRKG